MNVKLCLTILTLLITISNRINAHPCDKVGILPPDMERLLPQYQDLKRFHLSNYYFLDFHSQEGNGKISITIPSKSVLKIQATPFHSGLQFQTSGSSAYTIAMKEENVVSNGLSTGFTAFDVPSGELVIQFMSLGTTEQNNVEMNNLNRKTHDAVCDTPYMLLEIYIETQDNLDSRLESVKDEASALDDLEMDVDDLFTKLMEQEDETDEFDVFEEEQKKKTKYEKSLSAYKITLDKNNNDYFEAFNVNVIEEYNLSVPENEYESTGNDDDFELENNYSANKFFLKMQMYSDFLFGGSFYFVLIHEDDTDELVNLNCYYNSKCIISHKIGKNGQALEAILTPGEYIILLISASKIEEMTTLRKYLNEVPVTIGMSVEYFNQPDDRSECDGRRLPTSFDYLLSPSENYFEYKGYMVMNLFSLKDTVEFTVDSDSLLRVVLHHNDGNFIEMELYEVDTGKKINHVGSSSTVIDALSNVFPNYEKLLTLQEHIGESDGLFISLIKNKRYKLVLNYHDVFIDIAPEERAACEMYYLKLAIIKYDYLTHILPGINKECKANVNNIDLIMRDFEDKHSKATKDDDYVYMNSNSINDVFYTPFSAQAANDIIYSREFTVTKEINFSLEVISEFVSSFIIPVIFPITKKNNLKLSEIESILHDKHGKIIYHENSIKLNLLPDKYMLVFLHGPTQFNNEEERIENREINRMDNIFFHNTLLPKCMSFSIKVHSVRLLNAMESWECTVEHYETLPSDISPYLLNRDKFALYNNFFLIPHTKNHQMLLRVKEKYLLRISYDVNSALEDDEDKGLEMNVYLKLGEKILRRARPLTIDYEMETSIKYLTYMLTPNKDYNLIFELNAFDDQFPYYESCRTFKLDLNLIKESTLKASANEKCDDSIPKLEDFAYEKLMNYHNTYFKYGSKSSNMMFQGAFNQQYHPHHSSHKEVDKLAAAATGKKVHGQSDLETHRPSIFTFKLNTFNKPIREFNYEFEVKASSAKVFLIIETPYASSVGISAEISAIHGETHHTIDNNATEDSEIIAIEDMGESGFVLINDVHLERGKYVLTFYVNTLEVQDTVHYSKLQNILVNQCVKFSTVLLLEDSSFDALAKNIDTHYEACPYLNFPPDLNLPGWIHPDTDFTINEFNRFKIVDFVQFKRFDVVEKSIFKFYIPDEHSHLYSYINLMKIVANQKTKVVEKLDNNDNYLNLVLEKGAYIIEFNFSGVGGEELHESQNCHYYDVYIALIPQRVFKKGISENVSCNESSFATDIRSPEYKEHGKIVLKINENPDKSYTFNIKKHEEKNRFVGELINNYYTDSIYHIKAFQLYPDNHMEEIGTDLVRHEHFIWVLFHTEPDYEYVLKIRVAPLDHYSHCSEIYFSYSYDAVGHEDTSANTNEILTHKSTCGVTDTLPEAFFLKSDDHQDAAHYLERFGGAQEEDGELYFYGDFLLPEVTNSLRSQFFIHQKSLIYVKVSPKYSNNENIAIEVFRDKVSLYRHAHSDYNGLLIYQIDPHSHTIFNPSTKSNSGPHASIYELALNFDKHLTDCEAFSFVFSIIPDDIYAKDYMACEAAGNDKLPDALNFDTTSQYSYSTEFNLADSKTLGFIQNKNGDFVKNIKLTFSHTFSLSVDLEYIVTDNMMDVVLEEVDADNVVNYINNEHDVIELGKEEIEHNPEYGGIIATKFFNANLKKTTHTKTYNLKLIFHKYFADNLHKYYKDAVYKTFCFGFNLHIEAVKLKLKKESELNTNAFSSSDEYYEEDTSAEIDDLQRSDFDLASGITNEIIGVEPQELKRIKIGVEFFVKVYFALDLDHKLNLHKYYRRLIYLVENSNISYGTKIYPDHIDSIETDNLKFQFKIAKEHFKTNTCYRLFLDQSFANQIDDEAIKNLEHLYCTSKCECNPSANYICTVKGNCSCHFPYAGEKCEKCVEGYTINTQGKCIDNVLINANVKCDDKATCSSHGKCFVNSFNINNIDNPTAISPCKCDEGFKSVNAEVSYVFCNACTNPIRSYPFCQETKGTDADSLIFTTDSKCEEPGLLLPERLYPLGDERIEIIDGGQELDGSLDLLNEFKVGSTEEFTEIDIPEDSIIRVFFQSLETNRATIEILLNKYDTEAIAYTDGLEKSESFIARLEARDSPYYLKINHKNLRYKCTRYKLKIVIKPVKLVFSTLKCKKNINVNDHDNLLPPKSITIDESFSVFGLEKTYIFPDKDLLSWENFLMDSNEQHKQINYKKEFTNTGILSKSLIDEELEYNIKIEVKTPVTLSINSLYDFLSSDITLALRDKAGKVIKNGEWVIPEANFHASDNDFINGVSSVLDPGVYFLTISLNLPANHLMQIIYSESENKPLINYCFKFNLHVQTNLIKKPDNDISTQKFESMYNRIISVEPEIMANINVAKRFEIFITFEDSIRSHLNDSSKTYKDVFYFENVRNKEKVYPFHAYLQGSLNKIFLIIYEENTLAKDECYELKYNLSLLKSDRDSKVTADTYVHKFCTKSCNCNPHTNFVCEEGTDKCICEEPYMGEGCYNCIDGWINLKGKCITMENCNKNFCNSNGKCIKQSNSNTILKNANCECDKHFTGASCSNCSDSNRIYPDCYETLDYKNVITAQTDTSNYKTLIESEDEVVSEYDVDNILCSNTMIPRNLDSLGYLHLDGNMHISSSYSMKHIDNKHYSTVFTIKEQSHLKIYIEHSKQTHVITVFLLDNNKELIHSGSVFVGPAGVGSATYLDVLLNPLMNKDNHSYLHYELVYFVREVDLNEDWELSFEEDSESELVSECFNIYLEFQIITSIKETELINSYDCAKQTDRTPNIIPAEKANIAMFDLHQIFFNQFTKKIERYTHHRDQNSNLIDAHFFYHEYFYAPDNLDKEVIVEIQIDSKFINSHVGVLLEIVNVPEKAPVDHKKLTARELNNIFEQAHGKLTEPICDSHCFTAAKKMNSVILNRILPSDTFFRVWLYDISPTVFDASAKSNKILNNCALYEMNIDIKVVNSHDAALSHKKLSALCPAEELPNTLNIKGWLGDSKYLQKWGFHVLDSYRIDHVIHSGSVHETKFTLTDYYLMRLVVLHGRVDADIELFQDNGGSSDFLISRSASKNFEDVIVVEIPPGKYRIVFKFFPPPSGFHKCETIRMEFSMQAFPTIQENIDRMVARHKNQPKFNHIDFYEHLNTQKDIFSKEMQIFNHKYTVEILPPFNIGVDDPNKYEASVVLSDFTFVIDPKDSGKLEFIAFVTSDFLLLDAGIYLTNVNVNLHDKSTHNTAHNQETKITSSTHRKNLNMLQSNLLEAGTYYVSIRYYRRLHYKKENEHAQVQLFRATFAEMEFGASLINRSNDIVRILNSNGNYIELAPFNSIMNSISHNWLCRHSGLPIPKTLNTLRYLKFSHDVHILDNFLLPTQDQTEEIIKFKLQFTPAMMIRIYVESHHVNIDLELREKDNKSNSFKTVAKAGANAHFETLMHIINDEREYEIVLKFNLSDEIDAFSTNRDCLTFKMEIALEKNHNYACPNSSKYALLTDLKPIPKVLPVNENNGNYLYDSSKIYSGEDNNSGYVYLLRKEADTIIDYATIFVEKEIDLKIEVFNDFIQAPINIFITQDDNNHYASDVNLQEKYKLAHDDKLIKAMIKDQFVLSFGDIYENRAQLLIKDLPVGNYQIFFYLPGLKTKFLNEPRVCSIYDIKVEIKQSRTHFREHEIYSTAEIEDDNLDLPMHLPTTLDTLQYLSLANYVNYMSTFHLRKPTIASSDNAVYNEIEFTVNNESLVEFYVVNNSDARKNVIVSIEGKTNYSNWATAVLPAGKYKASIKYDLANMNVKQNDEVLYTSNEFLLDMYVGFTPTTRVKEIYGYNNIQSSYHQCPTSKLPSTMDFNYKTGKFEYHADLLTANLNDLTNLKVGRFSINLDPKKSNKYRIIAEVFTDYVFSKLNLIVTSGNNHKRWPAEWDGNVGLLDIILPGGVYHFEIEIEEKILVNNMDCILYGLDIHIVDFEASNQLELHHPVHAFDSKAHHHEKTNILKLRCDGSVLPIELHREAEDDYHKIKPDGKYFLHLSKANYFTNKNENMNKIDINLFEDSFVRITTVVENPNEFVIIPKMEYYNHKGTPNHDSDKPVYLTPYLQFMSNSLRERNAIWLLEKNQTPFDDFYTLLLNQEQYNELSESQESYHCPYYSLDILIVGISDLVKRMECLKKGDAVQEYYMPKTSLPEFETKKLIKYYHEKSDFSFITENQYAQNFEESESKFFYAIRFDISDTEVEYHVNMILGYDHIVSQFEVYLTQYDHKTNNEELPKIIASSEPYFDKGNNHFPYKRILTADNLSVGKYAILFVESVWTDVDRKLKQYAGDNAMFCLPFSYSLDIIPVNEKYLIPEVVNVFPPGPKVFKSLDEDLRMKITFSKPAFSKEHHPITYISNFMNIVHAFYLHVKGNVHDHNDVQKHRDRLHPDKIEGNVDGKEWYIIFLAHHFIAGVDYELRMEEGWLFDVNYREFKTHPTVKFPIIRVETNKEDIFDFIDNISGNKDKLNAEKLTNADTQTKHDEEVKKVMPADSVGKCGKHGKLVYDNILKKQSCSCFDGFTGKFCDKCLGVVDKVTGKCVEEEDDDNEYDYNYSGSKTTTTTSTNGVNYTPESKNPVNYATDTKPSSRNSDSYVPCDKACVHGICDTKVGRCICEQTYTGRYCDTKKSTTTTTTTTTTNTKALTVGSNNLNREGEFSIMSFLFKLILFGVLVAFLFFLYKKLRQSYGSSSSLSKDYSKLPLHEYELSGGINSINSINANEKGYNDLELIPSDPEVDEGLVDLEIKQGENKFKRNKHAPK